MIDNLNTTTVRNNYTIVVQKMKSSSFELA